MLCKTITGFSSGLVRVPNVATANETGNEGYYFLKLRLQRSKPEYFTLKITRIERHFGWQFFESSENAHTQST